MINKQEILKILKEQKLLFNIDKFILFGSYATDRFTENSDVDIAYIPQENTKLTFERYLELEDRLKQKLKTTIDLMSFDKLNPLVKLHARKDFIYV